MKLLLDNNLSSRLKSIIRVPFAGIAHVGDFGLVESSDEDIWQFAKKENWVLVSKDSDFADMALLRGFPPKVIRLIVGNCPWRMPATVVASNHIAVVEFLEDTDASLLLLFR